MTELATWFTILYDGSATESIFRGSRRTMQLLEEHFLKMITTKLMKATPLTSMATLPLACFIERKIIRQYSFCLAGQKLVPESHCVDKWDWTRCHQG